MYGAINQGDKGHQSKSWWKVDIGLGVGVLSLLLLGSVGFALLDTNASSPSAITSSKSIDVILGEKGANKCPPNTERIKDPAICEAKAKMLGFPYVNKLTDLNRAQSVCNVCHGCDKSDGGPSTARVDATHGPRASWICKNIGQPTGQPTRQPTKAPIEPTGQPTKQPTEAPTEQACVDFGYKGTWYGTDYLTPTSWTSTYRGNKEKVNYNYMAFITTTSNGEVITGSSAMSKTKIGPDQSPCPKTKPEFWPGFCSGGMKDSNGVIDERNPNDNNVDFDPSKCCACKP